MAHDAHADQPADRDELKLSGYLAEFDNVDDLVHACEKVRDAGFTKWDAHSPFPVHGLDDAMGIRNTVLPWIVLVGATVGLGSAILMQWWMNAIDYPFLISGKPYFSIPSSVPIYFELTVLFSAITAFLCALVLNLLPQPYHPLFRSERFRRATDDRFFVAIDEADPLFEQKGCEEFLARLSKMPVEPVLDHAVKPAFPKPIVYGVVMAACLSFIPLAIAVRARFSTTDKPRINLVWDMDSQPKYKTQRENPFFNDHRSMRAQVSHTVAVSDPVENAELSFRTGKNPDGSWVKDLPFAAADLPAKLDRGRNRFAIYCAPCHGLVGDGNGMIHQRATFLKQATWPPPLTFHSDAMRNKTVGEFFDNISNGIRKMPAYAPQIKAEDRWAIILYVRALQRSQFAGGDDVTPQEQADVSAGKPVVRPDEDVPQSEMKKN